MEDRNIDELLFSLRSVEENLPWFEGEIYIVSPPGHIPSWLNISHPRVRMVNQNTLLPTDAQPTCNSFLIEFYLDQIVGLTETFIYMNDDFFFARPISPSRFFDDQVQTNWGVGAKIYPANPGRTTFSRRDAERMARLMDRKARLVGGARDRFHLPIWRASDGWTRAVCTEKFKTGTNSLRHFPYIWHKQVLSWVREVVRSDLQRMFDHKFRNQRDLQAPSLLFGAYHHLEEFYGVTLFSEVPHEDSARFTAGGGCYDNKITREKEFEWLRKGGFEMFNLNTDYNRVPSGEACREFLEDLFGSPSSFEWKADGIAPTGTVDL